MAYSIAYTNGKFRIHSSNIKQFRMLSLKNKIFLRKHLFVCECTIEVTLYIQMPYNNIIIAIIKDVL